MHFIVKFFPEITIKSKPVRKRFVKRLYDNLRKLLKNIDPHGKIEKSWDQIVIISSTDRLQLRDGYLEVLSNTPGICHFLDVVEYPLGDLEDIYKKTWKLWSHRLTGKTFAVRCKRTGKHNFSSIDVERHVGGGLCQHTEAAGVDLSDPDITVNLEVRDNTLYIINQRHQGLGGFPLGELDPVLSLLSGGFDSTVASYLCMRRGMCTHFCFFNIGGRDHERGVKEVALYLWMKYGASSRVRFVVVPFQHVVETILKTISNPYMGVILKRMMLRAATQVAQSLGIHALVTGESVAQVSSQTLANLSIIDKVTNMLVLRPLSTTDKDDIIHLARTIGTEAFAAAMPEYCGVVSVKPITRAKQEKVVNEESHFDFSVLDSAIAAARITSIDSVLNDIPEKQAVDIVSLPFPESVVIDIRHPNDIERKPLKLTNVEVKLIPFYHLHSQFPTLDAKKTYLLYCDKSMMSRLHAAHLMEAGHANVKVYRP